MRDVECDLVIAGAGPGGLAAANRGAARGLDVVILEKQYEIGHPIRTTGCSFMKDTKELGIPEKYCNRIRTVVFASKNKHVSFSYDTYPMCVMDIRGVYQHLANEAMRHGARLELGTDVKSVIMNDSHVNGVNASGRDGEVRITSKVTIDATGFPALLSRQLGVFPKTSSRFAAGAEYEAYCENLESDTIIIIFDRENAPCGYAWIFPVSKERARIGVASARPDTNIPTLKSLDNFVFKNGNMFVKELGKVSPIELHAGNVPIEPIPAMTCKDGFMCIGDAAAQATPVAGEGIRNAMNSGIAAADSAADAIKKGDVSEKSLSRYTKHANSVAEYNRLGLKVQKRILELSDEQRDHVVESVIGKMRNISEDEMMTLLKGEFSKVLLLKIAAKNPGAVTVAVKNVLKL